MSNNYIMDLRTKVGTLPLVVSVAGCIILDEDNRILLQHRTDNGLWSHPGGAVELGETVEEAVRREIYEETEIQLDQIEFFKIYSGESQHCIYPNGDEVYFVNVIYTSRSFFGEAVTDNDENLEVKFFEIDDLPPMSSSNRNIIEEVVENFRGSADS
jgi:8-oxo-dGTP pyrophosphatase MutT (NUDIX family)